MLCSSIFDEAPTCEGTSSDDKIDELITWFRRTYPERNDDIGPEELYRSARDYVTELEYNETEED